MAYKNRTVPDLLSCYRILNTRSVLNAEEKKYLYHLEKGYEGELNFDLLTEKLKSECLVLNDLSLEVSNAKFQLDTTIIFKAIIYIIEVKNFEGDYSYEQDEFKTILGTEIKNPLDQLKRSKLLLRQLLQSKGLSLPIEALLVFVNPEFTLYQAPASLPFIFPTQLNRFMKKLDSIPSTLNSFHTKLADTLVSLHKPHPYTLPAFHYNSLDKGLSCFKCYSFSVTVQGNKIVCFDCGCTEPVETAILRCAEEIRLLFPGRRITTNDVREWCRVVQCGRRIRRTLGKNLDTIGTGRGLYYE